MAALRWTTFARTDSAICGFTLRKEVSTQLISISRDWKWLRCVVLRTQIWDARSQSLRKDSPIQSGAFVSEVIASTILFAHMKSGSSVYCT